MLDTADDHRGDRGTVVLGVAASDSHAVANHLIAYMLRTEGFRVVNLGTCTSVAEFADAADDNPGLVAVLVGSLNGHAAEDLRELPEARAAGRLPCPVIVGGNLSVGWRKSDADGEALRRLGVDHLLADPAQLPDLLDRLALAARIPALATLSRVS